MSDTHWHVRLEKPIRYSALVIFDAVFLLAVLWITKTEITVVPLPFWLLIAFAANRIARAITKDYIFVWLREPFTDEYGDVRYNLSPFWHSFGKMITCPICTGTWAALVLTLLVTKASFIGYPLIVVLALASVAEIINHHLESSQSNRL
jgi:hypothetical protein